MSAAIPTSLNGLQRWMLDAISHPEGASKGAQESAALSGRSPHAVIARSKNLTSRERLDIYASMYFWRLQDCLVEDFPSVQYAVGEHEFAALAKDYVAAHPSRYYNLARLGEHFAKYLRGRTDYRYRLFLAELAELERAIEVVFDAEDAATISKQALKKIPHEQWAEMRLEIIPAFSLHACRYPVNAFVEAVRSDKKPELPERRKTWVAVYRKNYSVWRMDLCEQQFVILKALRLGRSVGTALEAGLAVPGTDMSAILGQVAKWFEIWTARGFFRALHRSKRN